MATDKTKKLYRVRDGIIAGVCGGLADFFGLDPSLIRIAFAWQTMITGLTKPRLITRGTMIIMVL